MPLGLAVEKERPPSDPQFLPQIRLGYCTLLGVKGQIQLDSETGSSGPATESTLGAQWVPPLSTMAYTDEYLYLTPDDVAGIRDLAEKNYLFAKSHRGLSSPAAAANP